MADSCFDVIPEVFAERNFYDVGRAGKAFNVLLGDAQFAADAGQGEELLLGGAGVYFAQALIQFLTSSRVMPVVLRAFDIASSSPE